MVTKERPFTSFIAEEENIIINQAMDRLRYEESTKAPLLFIQTRLQSSLSLSLRVQEGRPAKAATAADHGMLTVSVQYLLFSSDNSHGRPDRETDRTNIESCNESFFVLFLQSQSQSQSRVFLFSLTCNNVVYELLPTMRSVDCF